MSKVLVGNRNLFNWIQNTILVLISVVAAYFILKEVTPYLDWSLGAYGAYHWDKRVALGLHLFGGSVALAMGLPQFWMGFRNRFMRVHRWTGRFYVLGVLIGSIGAFLMATTTKQILGFGFAFSLFALGIVWIITTGAAYFAIVKRNISMHKEWMIRSYIVTFSFVTFRILTDNLPFYSWGIGSEQFYPAMVWSGFVFPLLIAEVVLQFRKR